MEKKFESLKKKEELIKFCRSLGFKIRDEPKFNTDFFVIDPQNPSNMLYSNMLFYVGTEKITKIKSAYSSEFFEFERQLIQDKLDSLNNKIK